LEKVKWWGEVRCGPVQAFMFMYMFMLIMLLAESDYQQPDSIGHHHHPHVGIFYNGDITGILSVQKSVQFLVTSLYHL